jgi:CBS domain-containing protein
MFRSNVWYVVDSLGRLFLGSAAARTIKIVAIISNRDVPFSIQASKSSSIVDLECSREPNSTEQHTVQDVMPNCRV